MVLAKRNSVLFQDIVRYYRLLPSLFLLSLLILITGCGTSTPQNPADTTPQLLIFADDFESTEPLESRYFEYTGKNSSFVLVPGAGLGGSHAMMATWLPGQVDAGGIKLAFGRVPAGLGYPSSLSPSQNFREIYWRIYLKNQEGWSGFPDKLSRAIVFGSPSNWAEAAAAHVWSSTTKPVLVLDPASGINRQNQLATTTYNDAANMRWLGAEAGHTPIFDPANAGRWFCIEMHVKLNTPGEKDGQFELFIDGKPEASISDLDWTASWQEYGINAIFIENYWNAGAPAKRVRYFDEFAVATQRIGCLPDD